MVKLIYGPGWHSSVKGREFGIAEAVEYATTPDPYSYETEEQRTASRAGDTAEMLGRLIETLHDKGVLETSDVAAIIGYGWEDAAAPSVEEED